MIFKTLQLPKFLYPSYETELVRIGNNYDGGYLIPQGALSNTKLLYSFGLSDDFYFEEDFYNKTGAKVICYDDSVNFKFFIKPFLFGKIKKLFQYIRYRIFFDGKNKKHIKKHIMPKGTFAYLFNENRMEDINSILKDNSLDNLFFKIDIEGAEYRILDELNNHASLMTGLVIEFHDIDLNFNRIKSFIENFELQMVHIHANNCGFISPDGFPRSVEITFSPPKFNKKIIDNKKKYPISLDQPNYPLFQDLAVDFID